MHLRATQGLLVGIAIAVLVAAGGRYGGQYFDRQAAKQAATSKGMESEFEACVSRYYAMHPDRSSPKGEGISLEEAAGSKDQAGATIPCQRDGITAAAVSAEDDRTYAAFTERWAPKVAVALLLMFAAPWAWQFLLRRIAELGAAFHGRPLK